ncbi:sigma-54 interaction domain-containing protein [Photobacterium sp. DNB23_23_1]
MVQNLFYRQAIEALTGTLNLEVGLQRCLYFLNQVMPGDVLSVHLWDEALCSLKIIATADHNNAHICQFIIPIEEPSRHIPRWEYATDIKIVNDVADDLISRCVEEALSSLYGEHTYSHMISRVRIGTERICDVVLLARGQHRYTEADAALFLSLDSLFGVAVSNSLKHQKIKAMHAQLKDENLKLMERFQQFNPHDLIGCNSGLKQVVKMIEEVCQTDAPVLITGETGVGKDVIANAIQSSSRRNKQAFIRVNCGAIPDSLIDSELFGHEKGAFTGATDKRIGRFERANYGTIFLDEVGELSKAAQVRLLRVLQNGEIERIGGRGVIKLNVRVIAATNRSLEDMVAKKQFRADLYYRLCLFPIPIPPLRDRLEDIPLFAEYFISQCREKFQLPFNGIAEGEIEKLQNYHWPGNIRELVNVIERSVISARGKLVTFAIHNDPLAKRIKDDPLQTVIPTLNEINGDHIRKVLALTDGKIQGVNGAAEILDINPHTLRSRIKKLGITCNKG